MSVPPRDVRGAEVVVIGAGIVGSAIAYRLAEAGTHVTIVDRGGPGSGTSGNSFAALYGSGPDLSPSARAMWNEIPEAYRELHRNVGGDWLHVDGALWITAPDDPAGAGIRRSITWLQEHDYGVETATPAQVVRELEPDLRIDPSVDVVYVTPGEGWVDGVRACHRLVHRAMERYQARAVHGEVVALASPGERGALAEVRLKDGSTLAADLVINAAGAWASGIARLAGSGLDVQRRPGAMVVTSPAATCLRHIVRTPGVYLRPDGGARILVQREPYDRELTDGPPPTLDHPFARGVIPDAARVLPTLQHVTAEAVRYGVRPIPKDDRPIIGHEPQVGGLYHAVMHSGIRRAAVVARAVSRELSGTAVAGLEPYRPGTAVPA